jgi:endonuclease/exonuclease/phosphatase family metal-dependent hydrolase
MEMTKLVKLDRMLFMWWCTGAWVCSAPGQGQQRQGGQILLAFYNVDNLYDTLDERGTDDEEYLPNSSKRWDTKRYDRKVSNIAKVIADIGQAEDSGPSALVGLCEIENARVLQDLVTHANLQARNYAFVHKDGPDHRGADVALLYDPEQFAPFHSATYSVHDPEEISWRTRHQLLVSGLLHGDTVHVVVAHWPSRRGGEKQTRRLRQLAAQVGRRIVDSLQTLDANARILYMGDLNDDPNDASVLRDLLTTASTTDVDTRALYNPMHALHQQGLGSLAYQGRWNLFDQILLSSPLAQGGVQGGVYNVPMVQQAKGEYAGLPKRTFAGDKYLAGYSDHFAVFVRLHTAR